MKIFVLGVLSGIFLGLAYTNITREPYVFEDTYQTQKPTTRGTGRRQILGVGGNT